MLRRKASNSAGESCPLPSESAARNSASAAVGSIGAERGAEASAAARAAPGGGAGADAASISKPGWLRSFASAASEWLSRWLRMMVLIAGLTGLVPGSLSVELSTGGCVTTDGGLRGDSGAYGDTRGFVGERGGETPSWYVCRRGGASVGGGGIDFWASSIQSSYMKSPPVRYRANVAKIASCRSVLRPPVSASTFRKSASTTSPELISSALRSAATNSGWLHKMTASSILSLAWACCLSRRGLGTAHRSQPALPFCIKQRAPTVRYQYRSVCGW